MGRQQSGRRGDRRKNHSAVGRGRNLKQRLKTQGSAARLSAVSKGAQRDAASASHVTTIKVIRTAQDRTNPPRFLKDPEMYAHDQAGKGCLPSR